MLLPVNHLLFAVGLCFAAAHTAHAHQSLCSQISNQSLTFKDHYSPRFVVAQMKALYPELSPVFERVSFEEGVEGSWLAGDPSLAYAHSVLFDLKQALTPRGVPNGLTPTRAWRILEPIWLDHMAAMRTYIEKSHPNFYRAWEKYENTLRYDLERDKNRYLSRNEGETTVSSFQAFGLIDSYLMQLDGLLRIPNIEAFQFSLARLPEPDEFTPDARELLYELSELLPVKLASKLSSPGRFYTKFRSYSFHLHGIEPGIDRAAYLEEWIRAKTYDFLIRVNGDFHLVKARAFRHPVNVEEYNLRKLDPRGKASKSIRDLMDEFSCFKGLLAYDQEKQVRRFTVATYFTGEFSPEVRTEIESRQFLWLDPANFRGKIKI